MCLFLRDKGRPADTVLLCWICYRGGVLYDSWNMKYESMTVCVGKTSWDDAICTNIELYDNRPSFTAEHLMDIRWIYKKQLKVLVITVRVPAWTAMHHNGN